MAELPKGNTELSRDKRKIDSLLWTNDEAAAVGSNGITAIEAYDESGHMACIPWLAVYRGEEIYMRVPADQVTVVYASR